MSTLSERVIEAIGTPPRFTVAEIAEAIANALGVSITTLVRKS